MVYGTYGHNYAWRFHSSIEQPSKERTATCGAEKRCEGTKVLNSVCAAEINSATSVSFSGSLAMSHSVSSMECVVFADYVVAIDRRS